MAEQLANLEKDTIISPYISTFEKLNTNIPIDGTIVPFTADEDAYYSLVSINNTAGAIYAYMLSDANSSVYYAAATGPANAFTRVSTSFIPLKKGTTVYLRTGNTWYSYVLKAK